MGKKTPPQKINLLKNNFAKIENEDDNNPKSMVHIADSVFDELCEP